MPDQTTKWLVKDDDYIIGPFTAKDIQTRMLSGQISPTEMALPSHQQCWIFLINYPEFNSWADKIRRTDTTKLLYQMEGTTITFDTNTHTFSFTSPANKATPNESAEGGPPKPLATTKETALPYQVVEERKPLSHTTEPEKVPKALENIMQLIKKMPGLFLLILAAGAIVFFTWWNETQKKAEAKKGTPPIQSELYFESGYYLKALSHWKKEQQSSRLKTKQKTWMQVVALQFQNKLKAGEALLKNNLRLDKDTKNMLKALIHVKNGDIKPALQHFRELTHHASSKEIQTAAHINRMQLAALTGHCDNIQSKKLNLPDHTLATILYAFCFLSKSSVSPASAEVQTIKKTLENIIKTPKAYYQEALLAKAYIHWLEKSSKNTRLIQKLLDTSPFLTADHYYSVFVDRSIYNWAGWQPLCTTLYQAYPKDKFYITLYSYCLSQSGMHKQARQYIQKAHQTDNDNPLIKAIHAYIIYHEKQDGTHATQNSFTFLLSDAVDSNENYNYFLPYILQARFCEKNHDPECAIRHWQLVLQQDPLSAYTGIANAYWHKKMYKEARHYLQYGMDYDKERKWRPLRLIHRQLKQLNF